MPFDQATTNDDIMTAVQHHHLDVRARIQAIISRHPDVKMATNQALAAGIPWSAILEAILPFIIKIIAGGPIDWNAIVGAILALILHQTPPLSIPLHPKR